jgi:hypothetical protein
MTDYESIQDLESSISTLSNSISSESLDELAIQLETENAKDRLKRYIPTKKKDYTVNVLTAFIDHLPSHGRRIILRIINRAVSDQELLKLSLYLETAVLIPRKTLYLKDGYGSIY